MVRTKLQLCVMFTTISTELVTLDSKGQRPLKYNSRLPFLNTTTLCLCYVTMLCNLDSYLLRYPK